MSTGNSILLLGLKGSGKTSYLAALWHLLDAREIDAALSASHLQSDREYLNRIRNDWLEFKDVGRSPLRMSETISLSLQERDGGPSIEVVVPDLSGETFHIQWSMRKATSAYADYVKGCTGLLLFIHPQKIVRTEVIQPLGEKEPSIRAENANAWTPNATSTQVQLIELLQFVRLLREEDTGLKMAVVVSAWDLITSPISPGAWLDSRLPLLAQFMTANESAVPFRIFGVSALGGDLVEDAVRLHAEEVPTKRIRVSEEDSKDTHDISRPLRFLLPGLPR